MLTGHKIQAKIPSHSLDCVLGVGQLYGKGWRDIQCSMSMVLDTRFHILIIMTVYYKMREILLQNATAILLQNATKIYYKMRQVFHYKMRQFYYKMWQLLPIATILLQNATVITKRDVHYKLRQHNSYSNLTQHLV